MKVEAIVGGVLRALGNLFDGIDRGLQSWSVVGAVLLALLVAFGLLLMGAAA